MFFLLKDSTIIFANLGDPPKSGFACFCTGSEGPFRYTAFIINCMLQVALLQTTTGSRSNKNHFAASSIHLWIGTH